MLFGEVLLCFIHFLLLCEVLLYFFRFLLLCEVLLYFFRFCCFAKYWYNFFAKHRCEKSLMSYNLFAPTVLLHPLHSVQNISTVLLHPSFFYFPRRSISITRAYYTRRSISTSILLSPRSCFFTTLFLPCFLFGPLPFYPNIIEKCLKIRDFSPFFFFFHKNPA